MALGGTRINPSRFDRRQIPFYIILIPLAIFMILPIIFIFSHSFKPLDELFAFPPTFFPQKPTLENFKNLFSTTTENGIPISRYIFNSVVVTVAVMFFNILISTMAAFALSKMKFKMKNIIFEINTIALMFVSTTVTIPRYLLISKLHIVNTYFAHILPLISMPVGVFLIKQFLDQVPDSLIEAAKVDGASSFYIYRKIVLPLIRPAIATVAILSFQIVWNNIETSSLYVNDETLRTFAFYMSTLTSNIGNNVAGQGMAAAATLIMFLPNLIMFIVLQSNVMNTMAYSGIK
ncbi:MAG TPA: carbohydrate ABC transporter permease [Fervidobacterium sp.]|nr:carbohydrate ABC transporter permease [Fervidobacterium sp.]MBP8657092.1 carbohydrate ABC transporter permease [Fervidobacterium sp.]HOH53307.1 carbohydrate ABC transporter permease [Fervidobacterium sp.]HOV53809.1 carbohydrate ABC transporter permease [Fervidobacterium sp.]HPT53579.1 carbohydrate ABC transporter permease [Fervidobacterium sp.]